MESFKLVSVIMPCYNADHYVEESVFSALNQTYKHLEVIVVDDGSTDSSVRRLEKLQEKDTRLKVFQQKNKGPGAARNRGLKESNGEYIAFLDADDYWSSGFIEKLVKMLASETQTPYLLAYCGWQNTGLSENRCRPFIPPDYSTMDLTQLFLGGCRWPIHAALFTKACVDKIGGFDERWVNCDDYDLWLRMSPFLKVVLVPEVLAFYRHHAGEQITKKSSITAENHWKIQREFLSRRPVIAKQIGEKKINKVINGGLLHRAYISYWERDLTTSHKLFRMVMKTGYGKMSDWKYMLPALFPSGIYKSIIHFIDLIKKRVKILK